MTSDQTKEMKVEQMRRKKTRQASQYADEDRNPCFREAEMSLKCMNDNNFDRDKCTLYFQNYRNCKSFWNGVIRDRRRQGIEPVVPAIEERGRIKEEYIKAAASR